MLSGLVSYDSSSESDTDITNDNNQANKRHKHSTDTSTVNLLQQPTDNTVQHTDTFTAVNVAPQQPNANHIAQHNDTYINGNDDNNPVIDLTTHVNNDDIAESTNVSHNNQSNSIDLTSDNIHVDINAPHPDVTARFAHYKQLKDTGVNFIASLHEQPTFYDPLMHNQALSMYNISQYGSNIDSTVLPLPSDIIGQPVDNYLALTSQQEIEAKLKHERIANTDAAARNHNAQTAISTTNNTASTGTTEQERKIQAALDKINAKNR